MYVERVLFIVAPPDSGKSTQLRSLFLDRRFGTGGKVPSTSEKRKLSAIYHISNDRQLFLRLTSPHEVGETPRDFHRKIRAKTGAGRWCVAGTLQPRASKGMPDIIETTKLFSHEFKPERTRLLFLSPTRHGETLSDYSDGRDLLADLLAIPRVEVACIDARKREVNGLLIADFFDFT